MKLTLKNTLWIVPALLIAAHANALTVKFGAASEKKINDVTLSEKAILEDAGKSVELTRVAEGLREKKVLFIWAKVYVAQLFVANKDSFSKATGDAAIESSIKGRPAALALTFLRDVDAKKIIDAFKESMDANHVKYDIPPYDQFMAEAQKKAEAKNGQTIWFIMNAGTGTPATDQLTLYREGKEGYTMSAAPDKNIQKTFLSIWFGIPADGGLEKLKTQLLK